MKTSELIIHLTKLLAEHGDKKVLRGDLEGELDATEIVVRQCETDKVFVIW